MTDKIKNRLLLILCAVTVLGFTAVSIFKAPTRYSDSERRLLAQPPKVSAEKLLSGRFMSDFESFSLDQFPLRDSFRSIKAYAARDVFHKLDNNGLYVHDGYLSKLEYPMNEQKLQSTLSNLSKIRERYIDGTDCNVYLSVIPDKNYFLAPLGNYPCMDYTQFVNTVRGGLPAAEYIDIFDTLELSDYYFTDQHWRQERITDTAGTLAAAMGADISADYELNTLDIPLLGAYVGQSAQSFAPDELHYLTNKVINGCIVTSYDTGKALPGHMYDFEKAAGRDAYELFLSGADALTVIENPSAGTERELIIFRDSFGSSIAPLLTAGYSKITLVDLRYIHPELLGNFVDFNNQDILFLYSTLILNSGII